MPRSRYDDDESPPRRGGRVAEYEDVEIRTGKGRRHRPEFLDDENRRDEAGPLVVREEEVIEERRRGGGDRERDRDRDRDRSRRRRRERDSFDEEDDLMSVRTDKSERSRRPKSHERARDVDTGIHIRGPHGREFDMSLDKDETQSSRGDHRRHRSRDFLEDASVHVRGRHGGEFDMNFDREHDSRSSRKSRGGEGHRDFKETEEEIEYHKGGREPERRKKARDSDYDVSREYEEEEIYYRPKRQPREVVNEEWVYQPKPKEPSPPAVARETEEWVFQPRRYERPPPMAIDYRDESINIREREHDRGGYEEEIRIRERSREPPPSSPPPRRGGYEEIRISERERSRSREPPPRARSTYDEEIRITQREREERPPPKPRSTYGEEIKISERERESSRGYHREEDITIRERDREREREPPRRSEELVIRRLSPSPTRTERSSRYKRDSSYERESAGTVKGGEQNEIVIRRNERDDTRSRAGGEREEIIIRRNEREGEKSPESEPEPPAPRDPIRAPPIHQEIITHHRHIDHGYEYRPPPPPPAPLAPPKEEEEIEIRRRETRDGRRYEDDLIIDRRREEDLRPPASTRGRASSVDARGPSRERDRWDIVDVPNTERIRINGGGSGESQEITWSRTNGVRRSDEPSSLRKYVGVPPKEDKMWTEITKDLVIREALVDAGYDFEETKDFFYVMVYLRYEDVRRLVRLSDDIRAKRKDRIRQLEWEQKMPTAPKSVAPPKSVKSVKSVAEGSPPPRAISERSWDEERERIVEREYFGNPRGPVVSPPPPPSYDRRRPREVDETITFRQR